MVRFLIHRPVAVFLTFLSICIVGTIAAFRMPVSLMPAIDIPEITVQISYPNSTALQLENNVTGKVHNQLLQVQHLMDIRSETSNENAIIHLRFTYGTSINLAYIEVNEKIDRVMSSLPHDLQRPVVIKANASDIPVFYLIVSEKEDKQTESSFLELSNFARTVIRQRFEQLPEIAMADISGYSSPEVEIGVNRTKTEGLHITKTDIENALNENNIELGSITITDRQYHYNIRFASYLQTKEDVENIYLKKNNRLFQLKDIAEVNVVSKKQNGLFISGNKKAVILAIIKQADARIWDLKDKTAELVKQMETDYPYLNFEIAKSQVSLLTASISNLRFSLVIGALLAFAIMLFFMRNLRAPFLIGIIIPVSLIISVFILWLSNISINIISLSGLILGVGLMIDNSIIVIDNITQHIVRCKSIDEGCISGTNEIIRPLLSSALTTCAVFVPLVFLSGIAGALFYEQAVSVAAGLFASFFVSVTLIPVLYRMLYKNSAIDIITSEMHKNKMFNFYEKGMNFFIRKQQIVFIVALLMIVLAVLLYKWLPVEKLPKTTQNDCIVNINWQQNIGIDENRKRIDELNSAITAQTMQQNAQIGQQQFLLTNNRQASSNNAHLYVRAKNETELQKVRQQITTYLKNYYSDAKFSITKPENIFDRIFNTSKQDIELLIDIDNFANSQMIENVITLKKELSEIYPNAEINTPLQEEYILLLLNSKQLMLYDIEAQAVYKKLKQSFNSYSAGMLRSTSGFTPIRIGNSNKTVVDVLKTTTVKNKYDDDIPILQLVEKQNKKGFKSIYAINGRKYIPVAINNITKSETDLQMLRQMVKQNTGCNTKFAGAHISSQNTINNLIYIMALSVLLLYFILAIQFESLKQPFIVLFELPVDIFGALLLLLIFGATINIMSAIGIIVMSGIIINDSILKIDTINRLKRSGLPVEKAIIEGGHQRLKPIIMTSLTTILALIPVLFTTGLGSELQKPLALAVIGGMIVGTIVSLFLIPLLYKKLLR